MIFGKLVDSQARFFWKIRKISKNWYGRFPNTPRGAQNSQDKSPDPGEVRQTIGSLYEISGFFTFGGPGLKKSLKEAYSFGVSHTANPPLGIAVSTENYRRLVRFGIIGALESWGRALSNAPKIIKIASRITKLQFKTSGSMLILSPLYL